MPNLFQVGSYRIFFWSNENNEPNSCAYRNWETYAERYKGLDYKGGCIVANNSGRIPQRDLNQLLEIISAQYFLICGAWQEHFRVDKINYYC